MEVIFSIVELTILVLIPLEGIGLDFPRPLYKVFILDLHEYLGYRGDERRQHQVGSVRWSARRHSLIRPLISHSDLLLFSSPYSPIVGYQVSFSCDHLFLASYVWYFPFFLLQ